LRHTNINDDPINANNLLRVKERIISVDKRTSIVWSFYDFATTPVAFAINAMYLPLMVVAVGGTYSTVGFLSLITGIIAATWTPLVGTVVDRSTVKHQLRKWMIVVCSLVASIAIFSMAFASTLTSLLLLFIAMSVSIQTGWTAVNAYLAAESSKRELGSTSGLGILMGYTGGGIGALMAVILDQWIGRTAAFGAVGAFLFFFAAIPAFLLKIDKHADGSQTSILDGTINGAREVIQNRSVKAYLVGSVLWGDAISTIMTFASLIAIEVLLVSPENAPIFLGLALPAAAVGAVVQGRLGDRLGLKLLQGLNLLLWAAGFAVIIIWADLLPIILISSIAGFALGGNLTLSRALYASMIPKGLEGRLFGFAAVFTFFGGAIGPLLTGIVADLPGFTLRTALVVPLAFVLASLPALAFIQENGAPFEG
jgi:UMF1 family MFS transporter